MVAGDAVKANNIPSISITSTNPLITVNNEYYFCATFAETRQGDAIADFVYTNQGKNKVATVKVTGDDTATATVKRFSNRIKKLSGNSDCIVGEFELAVGSTDYSETIKGIRESGAQAVFLAVSPTVAEEFLKQADKANMTKILYAGTKSWNDKDFLDFVQKDKKFNIAYASDFSSKVQNTEVSKEFIKAYQEKYGKDTEPSDATAIAFDAYLMAIEAIQKAYDFTMEATEETITSMYSTEAAIKGVKEELEIAKKTGIPSGRFIRTALSGITGFEGASGVISFSGTNEATKNITVNFIKKGDVQEGVDVVIEDSHEDEDTKK